MKLKLKYTIAWILWILAFVGIEAVAVLNKEKGDTLSEHFWKLFDIKHTETPSKIMRFGALAGLTWIYVHLLTGWV